jgi:hypothetical protein
MSPHPLPQAEPHFRLYETTLAAIIARYPAPSEISFSGAGQSTVRINLKLALENYLAHPSISSTIPRDRASLLLREFVFSNAPDGKVYIGPRRPSRKHKGLSLASDSTGNSPPSSLADEARSLPPIDCSSPTTLHAVLHLKNFDHITIPLTISNVNLDAYPTLTIDYPNIELVPTTNPSAFTLL